MGTRDRNAVWAQLGKVVTRRGGGYDGGGHRICGCVHCLLDVTPALEGSASGMPAKAGDSLASEQFCSDEKCASDQCGYGSEGAPKLCRLEAAEELSDGHFLW